MLEIPYPRRGRQPTQPRTPLRLARSWFATDLKASYEVFAKRLPDAVLLDIHLGAEDGLDLVAWMRQKPGTREIPVIAVTAHALASEQEQILQASCRACLSKPIDFQLLREGLNRWLLDSKRRG